ncbi:MAG: DUF5683 domain-containing protein [Bacteroidia bacterium]
MKKLFLLISCISLIFTIQAQDVVDTSAVDSLVMEQVEEHSPAKATILSAILPGAGQFYNKKYWKIPILYAGFATVGYAVDFNQDRYRTYRNALQLRIDGDETTVDVFEGIYSEENLRTLKDFYRRNRDLSIIIGGIVYVLNIIDAHVDAHLFYFDVTDDLSMKLSPALLDNNFSGYKTAGFSIIVGLN